MSIASMGAMLASGKTAQAGLRSTGCSSVSAARGKGIAAAMMWQDARDLPVLEASGAQLKWSADRRGAKEAHASCTLLTSHVGLGQEGLPAAA